jgi:hypothetical protein
VFFGKLKKFFGGHERLCLCLIVLG